MNTVKNVPVNYNASELSTAKKIALVRNAGIYQEKEVAFSDDICEKAKYHDDRGDYREAAAALVSRWKTLDAEIDLTGLATAQAAQLLLRAGSILSAVGTTEQLKNAQDTARDLLWQSARLFSETDDADGEVQSLNKIGVSYWRNGDFQVARNFFKDSLTLASTDESKAIALLNIAMAEHGLEKAEAAMAFSLKAYGYIGRISKLTEAKIRNRVGICFETKAFVSEGEEKSDLIDRAIIEYESAILCYQEVGHEKLETGTRNNIGFLYYSNNQFQDALKTLEYSKTRAYQLKDKIHISLVCDTLARVYLATKNYESALANSSSAVKYLEENENSNRLSTYLCIHGVALARNGRAAEAKQAFTRAREVADYIGDRNLIAQSRLYRLREFFSDYEKGDQLDIFELESAKFAASREKDLRDLIEEISAKLEGREAVLTATAEIAAMPPEVDIDAEIIAFQRPFIEKAIAATGGNQSQAARLLGLTRQTFYNRVKKDYPDLFRLLQKIKNPKTEKVENFPSHRILRSGVNQIDKTAISILENDFSPYHAGDAMLIALGIWHLDKIVLLKAETGNGLKIGILRDFLGSYHLELGNGVCLGFNEEGLKNIVGEVIGYCPAVEYQKYLRRRTRRATTDLPYRLID